jgi:hypothetical protein
VLVDVAPDGSMTTLARGFLNVDYRDGLETAKPAGGEWVRARVRFLPQDAIVQPGHRIGLLVQSSNTVWAIPGVLGQNDILTGPKTDVSPEGSSLLLPLAPITPVKPAPNAPLPTVPPLGTAPIAPGGPSPAPIRATPRTKTAAKKKTATSRKAKLAACNRKAKRVKGKSKRAKALKSCKKRYGAKPKPKRKAKKTRKRR